MAKLVLLLDRRWNGGVSTHSIGLLLSALALKKNNRRKIRKSGSRIVFYCSRRGFFKIL
ncbi:Uncharacterized protein Nst1_341 [Candidatus Nanobsidianus stetteri]|uniref:Uncharacterized protein n=1 Tax=Nanobsidianus stetteri TaxID=1294122 RepID=R1G3C8_NANST|nr:Uncharacterized protein Nst1_341 [Candidatus Nanobsidianus stetteri]